MKYYYRLIIVLLGATIFFLSIILCCQLSDEVNIKFKKMVSSYFINKSKNLETFQILFPVREIDTLYTVETNCWNGNILSYTFFSKEFDFVKCKAAQNPSLIDSKFYENLQILQSSKIIQGAYHFFVFGNEPINQTKYFCAIATNCNHNDFPIIVYFKEISGKKIEHIGIQKLQDDNFIFLQYLDHKTNRMPIFNSDSTLPIKYLNNPILLGYPLWLAKYTQRH